MAEERGYILERSRAATSGRDPTSILRTSLSRRSLPRPGAENAPYPRDPRSEKDILNVTDIVAAEYNPASRIYMFANSTAGAGVWYLAHQYPERWATAGVASGPISLKAIRLKN